MRKRRLPPQPTDSRLARFVARQVRRWPFAWASSVRDRDRRIGSLSSEIYSLYREIDHIRRDYVEIMERLAPSVPYIDVRGEVDLVTSDFRICVTFDPIYLHIAREDIALRHRMSGYGQRMAEVAARSLSHEHCKQVEKAILANLARLLRQKEHA